MEDKERTLYCGNLSDKVTEDILYELFLQAGPLESVTIPKEKDGHPKNYAFIAFKHAVSVQYALALMNGIALYGRTLKLDPRGGSNEVNPYLQQLHQYSASRGMHQNNPGYYPQNDRYHRNDNRYSNDNRHPNDNRYPNDIRYPIDNRYPNGFMHPNDNNRHNSRWNEPRVENQFISPVVYPSFEQPYLPQAQRSRLSLPPPVNNYYSSTPNRHDESRSRSRR